MIALRRRILRLAVAGDRRAFRHLSDDELDAAQAVELRRWIAADPDACPAELRAEALAFLKARDLRRWRHLLPGGASRQRCGRPGRGRPGSVRAL